MLTRVRAVRMGHRGAPGRPRTADAGVTLIELTVGMTLMAVVGAIALQLFVGSTTQANRVTEQSQGASDARVAAEHVADELRLADTPTARAGYAANRFETTTATTLVFYANLSTSSRTGTTRRTPPVKLQLTVANGKLTESTYWPITSYTTYPSGYDYTTNYRSTPSTTTVLLSGLPSTLTTVFTYCTAASDPTTSCTAATATDKSDIAAVGIELAVAGSTGNATQRVRTTVAITGAVTGAPS